MIRINLLPYRTARKKENIRRQISIFLLSFILLALISGYALFILNGKISDLNAGIEDTKAQIAKYERKVKEINSIKKELDMLARKMKIIDQLDSSRKGPVKLLDAMTQLIVQKRMWFVSFNAIGSAVSISGVALDNKTVADFMTRLENSGLFSGVSLKTLKQTTINNLKLKQFDISCARKG